MGAPEEVFGLSPAERPTAASRVVNEINWSQFSYQLMRDLCNHLASMDWLSSVNFFIKNSSDILA